MYFEQQNNLSVRIAQWIANQIIIGHYPPFSRVREEAISKELDVSRGPIREALLILQRQRLVDILPRRGAVVTPMSEQQIVELYDVVCTLYTLLAVNLAQNWKEGQLNTFESLLKLMEIDCSAKDHQRYFENTVEFMKLGYLIAKNDLLENLLEDLIPSVNRVQYLAVKSRRYDIEKNYQSFKNILNHIKNRDISALKEAILSHNEQEKAFAIKALQSQRQSVT